MVLKMQIYAKN